MIRPLHVFVSFLLSFASLAHAAAVQFSARQDIATSARHLTGLAVADFNGDGKPDLAVTDDYSQTVTVYLNDGSGHFPRTVTSTFNVPGIAGFGFLVAGDVNEDGKQDLIIGPIGGLQYDVVLLGNGDGTFTEKGQIANSYGLLGAALLDINGDKHLDLIAGANGGISVSLGDGHGNFTGGLLSTPSGLFYGLTAGDFNGDKIVDFVAADLLGNQLRVFTGKGDGTFQSAGVVTGPNISSPGSLASADFNGDGKLDLLVGSSDISQILLGVGDGTFQTDPSKNPGFSVAPTSPPYNSGPLVTTADMDGNGTPDIITADNNAQAVSVVLNRGQAVFGSGGPDFQAPIDLGGGTLQVADLNGDGLPDIILTNGTTQKISIFLSVIPTPTITVQSSAAQSLVGSSPTVAVQVSSTGSTTPTGTVTVTSGTTTLGQQTLDTKGAATLTLSNLMAGQYPLTVAYSGDKYNQPVTSTSASIALTDFQVALPSPTESAAAGAAVTYPVTLTPLYGFTGSVALSCTGLPAGYTCAPATASLTGAAATSVNLVISPPAQTAAIHGTSSSLGSGGIALLQCGLFGLCFLVPRRFKRSAFLLFACILIAGGLGGCSSGGSHAALYTGTSSFTVTATATQGSQTVSHQASATLAVH